MHGRPTGRGTRVCYSVWEIRSDDYASVRSDPLSSPSEKLPWCWSGGATVAMPSSTLITQLFLGFLLPSLQHGRSRPVIVRRSPLPTAGLSKNDPRVFTATLDRKTGIDFGCDLTLSWAYVLALDPDGSAAREGSVLKGDQLVAVAGASVLGAPIGQVMEALAALEGAEVDLMFFRGPRTLLRELTGANTLEKTTVRITVQEPGNADRELVVPYGANLRDELVSRRSIGHHA